MAEGSRGRAGDIVAALRAVAGVALAEISPDGRPGGAGTLKLTLEPGADEVQVAVSVNALLREQFGLAVDAQRVSVSTDAAELDEVIRGWAAEQAALDGQGETPVGAHAAPGSVLEPDRGPRLVIQRLQLVSADLGVDTAVTLSLGEDSWTGEAAGAATPTSVQRAVAMATLRAVEESLEGQVRFELEGVALPMVGLDSAVVVEISMITRRGTERLVGISTLRDDAQQAVVRATLAALNRRLEGYLVPA